MIKTLQKKFIVTAMIAVTVLLAAVLGLVNVVNAATLSRQDGELLSSLAMQEGFGPAQPFDEPREHRGMFREPMTEDRRLSALFFTVRFDGDGKVVGSNLRQIASVDEQEAEELARQVLDDEKGCGRVGDLRFQIVEPAEGFRTVIFLDVSAGRYAVRRYALLSLLAGALAWVAMLALVCALSRRAIRPIAENMERQRRFVTDAGHELKTPLAIIQANLDAMELTGGESKYSRNIRSQTQRLSGLTRTLLTLARMDESQAPPAPEELDYSALVRESLEMFRAPAELKELRLTDQIGEGVRVRASREQLGQLLSILLDNAVKYCPRGGALGRGLSGGEHPLLTISNSTEMPVDTDHIFDRFYRGDSSRNQQSGGYGIGLSAARAIVRLHKGEISARWSEGEGITFTVRL